MEGCNPPVTSQQGCKELRQRRKEAQKERKQEAKERKEARQKRVAQEVEGDIFHEVGVDEAQWKETWEAQLAQIKGQEAQSTQWEDKLQRGRWAAVAEMAQEEALALQAEEWWASIEEALTSEAEEKEALALEAPVLATDNRLEEAQEGLRKRRREAELNRVNTQVQKAKARREKLLAVNRQQLLGQLKKQIEEEDAPVGGRGLRPTWSVQGEVAVKLGRARRQEVGVGWKPDARPSSHRRKRYRPQRMMRLRQRQGMVSTMACLGLLLAMGAEGSAVAVASQEAALWTIAATASIIAADRWGNTVLQGVQPRTGKGGADEYPAATRLTAHEDSVRKRHDQQCADFRADRWEQAGHLKTWDEVRPALTPGPTEEGPTAQIAAARRARFTATSAEVELLQGEAVVNKLPALLDSGAVLSCATARSVKGLHSQIDRTQAAALCTADGSPMKGMKGMMKVRFRFVGSTRVFEMGMQVVEAKVPFILGMDFLKQEKAVLNYASGELCLPPVKGWPAMATPMQMGGVETVSAMMAAIMGQHEQPSETLGPPTAGGKELNQDTLGVEGEEPYLQEGQSIPTYATEDVVIEPGAYRHVDARLGGQVHLSDNLLLDSLVEVCLDRAALNEVESWREQAADLRDKAAEQAAGDEKKRKRLLQQCESWEQQASTLRQNATGQAQFPALVRPWMDEGADWMGVSTVLHNQGTEDILVRKGSCIAQARLVQDWESGPQLWQEQPDHEMATVGVQDEAPEGKRYANPQEQYLFQPGDWRHGKSGREIVEIVRSQHLEEFLEWHVEWYEKLVFGERFPQAQQTQLAMLLFAHRKIITVNPKAPSVIKGVKHYIPFDTSQVIVPYKGRLRRLSPAEREAQDEETRVLLESGLVRPSTSPWGAGTVIVPKKDGGRRYAIDYRAVNKVTIRNCHPLPRCDDICDAVNGAFIPRQCPSNLPQHLPSLQEAKRLGVKAAWHEKARRVTITSAFDIHAAFHGVEVAEEDRYKTAFSTWGYGLLEWVRMPFGLHGAPQTFQAGMESVLQGLCNVFCVIYIDDCACFSVDFEEHVDHLGLIFERLDCANISIKISKCVWGTDTLPLLGHLIVAGEGVRPDPMKVDALARAAVPETTGQIKSFLAACSYYRKFIPHFAVMAEPLRKVEKMFTTKTARVKEVLLADVKALKSYEALKAALVNAPVLQAPDFTKPFIIISDASKYFVGGCLCQRADDGVEKPIAYTSRPLRGAELNYAITDAEGLAMVHCCALWRHFISSSPTVCITDHVSLTSLLTKREHGSGRQARYAMDLQEFDLQIVHRSGESRKMALADFVSRTPMNPQQFELHLMQPATNVGSASQGYKDSELWAAGTAVEAIQQALEEAQVAKADQSRYNLQPGAQGAKELVSAVHADLFRRDLAWGRCKPADPDESRAVNMLDTICTVMVQEAPMGLRASTKAATAHSKATGSGKAVEPAADTRGESSEGEQEEKEEEADRPTTALATGEKPITRSDLIRGIEEVPKWKAMQWWKLKHVKPTDKKLLHFVERFEANYECDSDGALWRMCWRDEESRLTPVKQLVVPPSLQEQVVRLCHAGPEGAHRKVWTTYHKLRERFWFPNAHSVVNKLVEECPVCQLHGASQRKAPLEGHAVAKQPGEQWVCDLLHLKRSAEGYAYILVCIDVFSRYVELVPLKGGLIKAAEKGEVDIKVMPDSAVTAQAFMNSVVQHWGVPTGGTTTDGGPEFKAHWKQMHQDLRLQHRLSTPHHPDGHGLVERVNRSAIEAIAKLVQDDDEHWQSTVPWCQLALNAAPHRALFSSGGGVLSPAEAHTGSRLHLAIDFHTDPEALGAGIVTRRVQDALAAQEWVQQQRDKYNTAMERVHAGRPRRTFAVGDRVCLQYPDHDKLPQKLKEKYAGPYKVTAAPEVGSAAYVLQREAGGARQFTAHVQRLKAYRGKEGPSLGVTAADVAIAKSKLFAVARILAHREAPAGKEYQVLWEPCVENDWDDEEITWEAEGALKCPDRVQEYHKRGAMVGAVTIGQAREEAPRAEVLPVQADLLQGDPSTLVQRVCEALNLDPRQVLLVWASTPCETFSRADPSNITRGHHYRDHSDPEKPPKSDDLSDLKVLKAVEHDQFLPRLQQMVAADRQRGLQYNFVFENPRASLRCRPYMQLCAWPKVVDVVRRTVDLCAFRHIYKKGTDLWTSLSDWNPRGTTGNGRCQQKCEGGKASSKGYRHFYALAVEPERELQGQGVTARRNHMPELLLKEIVRAAQAGTGEERRVVIDLCAGYRSLQGICEAEGLVYVPVDIRYGRSKDAVVEL